MFSIASLRRALGSAVPLPPFQRAMRAADQLRDAGRFAEAADAYRVALALRPNRPSVKVQLANMLKDSGQFDEAEATYLDAIVYAPGNADIHLQLGHLHKLTGRRSEALACYRQALLVSPNLAAARRELAAAGDQAEQVRVYEQQMREGGVESLMLIRNRLDEMSVQIEQMRNMLPDSQALVAFPVEAYAEMRRMFDPPPPRTTGAASIGLVLCADREPLETLHRQLTAVINQSHRQWRLRVLVGDSDRREIIKRVAAADARISWVDAAPEAPLGDIELATAKELSTDWTLLMAEGAVLQSHALAWIAAVALHRPCDAIVFDEEVGAPEPYTHDLRPILRQAVDRESLLEANIYGETVAVRSSELAGMSAFVHPKSSHTLRSELLLNLVGLHPVAHVPLPLVRRVPTEEGRSAVAAEAHAQVVRAYRRLADEGAGAGQDDEAEIAIIICTKNNSLDVATFVESLRALAARADRLEILIVDNGDGPPPDARLAALAASKAATVWKLDEPFNWSRFNNLAAARTRAPYLIFANDDMRMLAQGWDSIVRSQLVRPEIGALGARLLYPDETLQHAGMLFNWRGGVIHDGLYRAQSDPGPSRRWQLTRCASAVTGAFLATRRADFAAVGGFDEANLAISYGDVDYALKLRAAGLRVLWSPSLTLYHYESKTRGLDHLHPAKAARHLAEQALIERRWLGVLLTEPSVNPAWYQATIPFRLLRFPSQHEIWRHIETSVVVNPWLLQMPKS